MKISKTLFGMAMTVFLLAGWQKTGRAEEAVTEAVKAEPAAPAVEVKAAETPAPAAEVKTPAVPAPAHETETAPAAETAPSAAPVPADATITAPKTETAPASEATAPAATAPAHVEEAPAAEKAPSVPADATKTTPASAVDAPVTQVPSHAEKKEESSPVILSVADLFAKKAELNGKVVTVSGNIVKVNLGVMGKNWIHLQDGTGSQGTNDITVTTADNVKLNDKVTVTGTVATDKDFTMGYKYSMIIENATVKK